MIVTRDQAICLFYYEEYNEDNIIKLKKKLDSLEDLDICYLTDPEHPVLVFKTRIRALPFTYKSYPQLSKQSGNELPPQQLCKSKILVLP